MCVSWQSTPRKQIDWHVSINQACMVTHSLILSQKNYHQLNLAIEENTHLYGVLATKLSMKINMWIEITILYEKRSAGTKNYANA